MTVVNSLSMTGAVTGNSSLARSSAQWESGPESTACRMQPDFLRPNYFHELPTVNEKPKTFVSPKSLAGEQFGIGRSLLHRVMVADAHDFIQRRNSPKCFPYT